MTEASPGDAWTPLDGPDFHLELPAGWTLDEDEHGLIGLRGDGAEAAIWPVTLNRPLGGRGDDLAADLLRTLAGRLRPGIAWRQAERFAAQVWTVEGDASHESGFARLVLGAPTPQGQPAWLFLAAAADRPRLEALRPAAERIFRSYRPVAAGRSAAADGGAHGKGGAEDGETGRFVEPTEQAFTVAVPAGWQAQAGVVRHGVFGAPWLRLLAADGAEIRDFDPRWPISYLEPNPTTHAMGRPVGSVADGVMIRPFTPPDEFAVEYATWMARERGEEAIRVTRRLAGPAVLDALPAPFRAAVVERYESDLERQRRLMPQVQVQPAFGTAAFTTSPGGQAGLIHVFGSRSAMPGSMSVIQAWTAGPFGFLGPAARRDEMERTLYAVGISKRVDPRWQQRQDQAFVHKVQHDRIQAARHTAHLDALARQSANAAAAAAAQRARSVGNLGDVYSEISDITHQGYMDRQRSSDEFQRRTVNAVHEQVDVFNPATGDVTYGVPGHARYHFVDAFGNTVGTDVDDNPDPMRLTRGQNLDDLYDTGGS